MGSRSTEARKAQRRRAREVKRAALRNRRAVVVPVQAEIDARDAAAWRADRERVEAETYARLAPDDSRHRPRSPSPLEVGAARVTGVTAVAARRQKALTRYEYDLLEGRR